MKVLDEGIRDAFVLLVGSPVPNWAWNKACLPSSLGGLGLRSANLHGPAAYLGSLTATALTVGKLVNMTSPPSPSSATIRAASDSAKANWMVMSDIPCPPTQRSLSEVIDDASFAALLSSAPDTRSKALARSSSLPKAGVWVSALPCSALGLHLRRAEFVLCLRYWLGLPLFPAGHLCPACGSPADQFGDHHVGCGGSADRIHRHNLLRDALFSTASSAALAPLREVPGLVEGSNSRPADVFLPSWTRGGPTAVDVTVVSPLQKALVKGAAEEAGKSLQVAFGRKLRTHDAACRKEGLSFLPLVVETLGGWEDSALTFVRRLAAAQASRVGSDPGQATLHLLQRLGMCLWRGNSAMWLRRAPSLPAVVDRLL